MKTKPSVTLMVLSFIVGGSLAIVTPIMVTSCGGGGVNDQLIISGVSIATSTGLAQIKSAETRHMVANLLQGYAPGLRTITNNPTAEQLAQLVDQYTPADIKEKYPEAVAFATPLVVNAVLTAIKTFGESQPSIIKIMNDVATGLEIGAAGK